MHIQALDPRAVTARQFAQLNFGQGLNSRAAARILATDRERVKSKTDNEDNSDNNTHNNNNIKDHISKKTIIAVILPFIFMIVITITQSL